VFRYKVRLSISDGSDEAVFVIFVGVVHQLLGVPCATLVSATKVGD